MEVCLESPTIAGLSVWGFLFLLPVPEMPKCLLPVLISTFQS